MYGTLQRFSELRENEGVSSHQILTGRTDMSENRIREIMNQQTRQGRNTMMFTEICLEILIS